MTGFLFEIIDRQKKLPTTSAPSPIAFTSAFEAAYHEGADSILCICVSSKISATYNSAVTAAEMYPERDISVIDSQNLSMGQGFMVLAAAEAVSQGATKDEAIRLALATGEPHTPFCGPRHGKVPGNERQGGQAGSRYGRYIKY